MPPPPRLPLPKIANKTAKYWLSVICYCQILAVRPIIRGNIQNNIYFNYSLEERMLHPGGCGDPPDTSELESIGLTYVGVGFHIKINFSKDFKINDANDMLGFVVNTYVNKLHDVSFAKTCLLFNLQLS